MKYYEVRLDYADGTFDIVDVSSSAANEIAEATIIATNGDPEVVSAMVLAIVDRGPQTAFAFGNARLGEDLAEEDREPHDNSFYNH
jgi:hypothetical protein